MRAYVCVRMCVCVGMCVCVCVCVGMCVCVVVVGMRAHAGERVKLTSSNALKASADSTSAHL